MSPAVFAHGHLRLYLLSLLGERSMHGYELIQALADRFGGTYVPSAGTIYPRLAKLEEEGLVTKTADGRKTVYAITDAGRAELAGRESDLDGIESELTDSVRRLADEVRSSVDDAMRSFARTSRPPPARRAARRRRSGSSGSTTPGCDPAAGCTRPSRRSTSSGSSCARSCGSWPPRGGSNPPSSTCCARDSRPCDAK
ncbi:PadR family transcriptional regulator [Pseudolysinimonas kribbensis]|uniref:PadR family transcriptional regulator n=1 Tax=Pseudolysinimonas kribbensis TaxID=433641 RepID=UPI003D6672BD